MYVTPREQELANVQITTEEAIAAIAFDAHQDTTLHEEDAAEIGRKALRAVLRNLEADDFAALKAEMGNDAPRPVAATPATPTSPAAPTAPATRTGRFLSPKGAPIIYVVEAVQQLVEVDPDHFEIDAGGALAGYLPEEVRTTFYEAVEPVTHQGSPLVQDADHNEYALSDCTFEEADAS